uniref:NAD-specific glutamate dehydrogenase-like n=1 Tax=Dermatophagoides pteronyssinus TaxID=6956 RepID=A0A6P6Y4G6_DERPT|nr:NAD-specific glutamate dehydrogenase-like [Dermatophagoides pteronyssinus]
MAKHLLHRSNALPEEVDAEVLETRARDTAVEVHAVEERVDLDLRLRGRGQRALRALALRAQTAQRLGVAAGVLFVDADELVHAVVHEAVVEVLAAEVRVAGSRFNFENALVNRQKTDVERAAAEVEDEHVPLSFLVLLVKAIGDRSSGRLIDDAQNVQTRNGAGVFSRLALRVVEVRRDGDHSVLHLAAQVVRGNLLHLVENHCANLLRVVGLELVLELDFDNRLVAGVRADLERPVLHVRLNCRIAELAADQTLCVEDRVFRI